MKAAKRPYPRFAQDFSGDSATQQHFTAECDVNNIVAQFDRTGIDPYAERKAAEQYGDGLYRTYEDAMFTVAEINSDFNELPAHVRKHYENDPLLYLAAIDAAQTQAREGANEAPSEPLTASEPVTTPVEKDAE